MRNPLHRLLASCALAAVTFATPAVVAQSDTTASLRTVHLFRSYPHAPISIVKILNGTVEIKADTPFEGGDDWLQDLSIVVKNISPSKSSTSALRRTCPRPATAPGRAPE